MKSFAYSNLTVGGGPRWLDGLPANWFGKKLAPREALIGFIGLGPIGFAPMGLDTADGYPR